MNNLIILKYIKNLTPDDVYTYACKKDIILNSQELSGVYKYIKDNYADYLKVYLKKDVMLSDAKNVISTRPEQMIAPAVLIFVVVATFNLLGDCFRDLLDIKGESLDVKS